MDRRIRVFVILVDDHSFLKVFKEQEHRRRVALPVMALREILSREGCGLFVVAKDDDIPEKLQARL